MGELGTSYLLMQLSYQAPTLLVFSVAFVLALVYMRRASKPSILTLSGVGVLVVAAIGVAVIQASLVDSRQSGDRGDAEFTRLMEIVGIAGSGARAVGLGLLIAAIFVGRRATVKGRADDTA
jgi:hypothetical protein